MEFFWADNLPSVKKGFHGCKDCLVLTKMFSWFCGCANCANLLQLLLRISGPKPVISNEYSYGLLWSLVPILATFSEKAKKIGIPYFWPIYCGKIQSANRAQNHAPWTMSICTRPSSRAFNKLLNMSRYWNYAMDQKYFSVNLDFDKRILCLFPATLKFQSFAKGLLETLGWSPKQLSELLSSLALPVRERELGAFIQCCLSFIALWSKKAA